MTIAIIGGYDVLHKDKKIKELLFKIKQQFGNLVIIASGGNRIGAEASVKKIALEFGMNYVEYNPSFSGHNQYSVQPPEYFGKKYHHSHYFDRYKQMVLSIDRLVVVVDETVKDPAIKAFLKKVKVPTILI